MFACANLYALATAGRNLSCLVKGVLRPFTGSGKAFLLSRDFFCRTAEAQRLRPHQVRAAARAADRLQVTQLPQSSSAFSLAYWIR